ncbi:MAG: sugar phosphate isomerase/epimerase family protein, partial [bacterium]
MKMAFIGLNDLEGVEADAAFAAEHGFEGLEYNYWGNFAELTADTVKRMREALDRHGAACAALGLWGWNHLSPDPDEQKTSLGHLDRAIDFATTLGADVLITGGGDIPDADPEAKADAFAEVFPPYIDRIQDAGLTLALYPVHGNSFYQGIADYQRVWERG